MQIVYTTSNFKGGIYRAVLAILLGLALLIWPADALKYVVMLIGIVFLAIGIIAFIISSRNRHDSYHKACRPGICRQSSNDGGHGNGYLHN